MLTNKELELAKSALKREIELGKVRVPRQAVVTQPKPATPPRQIFAKSNGPGRPKRFVGVNPRKLSPEDRERYYKAKRALA